MKLDRDKIIEKMASQLFMCDYHLGKHIYDDAIEIDKTYYRDRAKTALKALARELPSMDDFYNEAKDICQEVGQKGNKAIEYYLKIEMEDYIDQLKELGNEIR